MHWNHNVSNIDYLKLLLEITEAESFLSPEECDYFVQMAKDEGLKESETVLNQPENQRFVLRDHDGNKKLSVREVLTSSIAYLTYTESNWC